jgi:hypothetical protein
MAYGDQGQQELPTRNRLIVGRMSGIFYAAAL